MIGVGSALSSRIAVDGFADHVFGVVGLNDWRARDIQAWEYVPLGPFLGKSFATSVSAWVTPLAALDAAWCDLPGQDPAPLDYLDRCGRRRDWTSTWRWCSTARSSAARPTARCTGRRPRCWRTSPSTAPRTRPGDLFACGTISGPEPDTRGSFLELSWGGTEPFADGRTFLEDGDEVTLRYSAPGTGGGRITLGEVTGRIEPARP